MAKYGKMKNKGGSEYPCRPGVTKGSSDRGAEADTDTPRHMPKINVGGSNEGKGKKGQT